MGGREGRLWGGGGRREVQELVRLRWELWRNWKQVVLVARPSWPVTPDSELP